MKSSEIYYIIFIAVFISSCRNQKIEVPKTFNFNTYEISFFDGWSSRFSLFVDSSKSYIANSNFDTLHFGVLPDSLLEVINKNAIVLLKDSFSINKNAECSDCAEISILLTFNNDSVKVLQKGDVSDRVFFPVIEAIDSFLNKSKDGRKYNIYSSMLFETNKLLLPPVPSPTTPPIRLVNKNTKPQHPY